MFARSATSRPVAQRVTSLVVTGLLALSLLSGVAGTTATVSAAPKQPPVYCVYFTQSETIMAFGFDPGPTGFWNCDFYPATGARRAN